MTPWTTGQDRALRGLYAGGLKLSAIARRLGRTAGAVSARAYRLGLVGRQRRKGELAAAVRHWAGRGLYDWEVGSRLDLHPATVARVRRELGVPATDGHQAARGRGRSKPKEKSRAG